MKYKVINKNYRNNNFLDEVLNNRGLTKEDVDKLLNADERYYKDPCKISGMIEAVSFFKQKIMEEGVTVGLLVDPDV